MPGIVRVVEWGKYNDFCAFSDERKECVVFVLSPLSGERQWVQMGEGVILEVCTRFGCSISITTKAEHRLGILSMIRQGKNEV